MLIDLKDQPPPCPTSDDGKMVIIQAAERTLGLPDDIPKEMAQDMLKFAFEIAMGCPTNKDQSVMELAKIFRADYGYVIQLIKRCELKPGVHFRGGALELNRKGEPKKRGRNLHLMITFEGKHHLMPHLPPPRFAREYMDFLLEVINCMQLALRELYGLYREHEEERRERKRNRDESHGQLRETLVDMLDDKSAASKKRVNMAIANKYRACYKFLINPGYASPREAIEAATNGSGTVSKNLMEHKSNHHILADAFIESMHRERIMADDEIPKLATDAERMARAGRIMQDQVDKLAQDGTLVVSHNKLVQAKAYWGPRRPMPKQIL